MGASGSKRARDEREKPNFRAERAVCLSDAFSEEEHAAAEIAETVEAKRALVQASATKTQSTPAARRAAAEASRVQGEVAASRGEFESALAAWEHALVALHGGPPNKVAAVAHSAVASTAV